jgi:hypothetical protein
MNAQIIRLSYGLFLGVVLAAGQIYAADPRIVEGAKNEGKLVNTIGNYPANPSVESDLRKKTAGYRLHPVNPTRMSKFNEINKQFMAIFWKNQQ